MNQIEQEVYDALLRMAERKQHLYVTHKILMTELLRKGFNATFDEVQAASGRIYHRLAAHPHVQTDPISDCLVID